MSVRVCYELGHGGPIRYVEGIAVTLKDSMFRVVMPTGTLKEIGPSYVIDIEYFIEEPVVDQIPKPTKRQRGMIKAHRSSVRTSFLLLMYLVIIGLCLALLLSTFANNETNTVTRIILSMLFGGISLFFVALVFVTIRDRQEDVIDEGVIEREEDL